MGDGVESVPDLDVLVSDQKILGLGARHISEEPLLVLWPLDRGIGLAGVPVVITGDPTPCNRAHHRASAPSSSDLIELGK